MSLPYLDFLNRSEERANIGKFVKQLAKMHLRCDECALVRPIIKYWGWKMFNVQTTLSFFLVIFCLFLAFYLLSTPSSFFKFYFVCRFHFIFWFYYLLLGYWWLSFGLLLVHGIPVHFFLLVCLTFLCLLCSTDLRIPKNPNLITHDTWYVCTKVWLKTKQKRDETKKKKLNRIFSVIIVTSANTRGERTFSILIAKIYEMKNWK